MNSTRIQRRHFIAACAASALAVRCGSNRLWATSAEPKRVAAIVTVYRKNSHADVIVGKVLEGWKQDGGAGPNLKLVSLFVDQFPNDDIARDLSKKHGFPIVSSIQEALTLGTNQLAVDGVLSIGEHGDYPVNDKGQTLYPRRRFFEEIIRTFDQCGSVVPVFNDKHPGPLWEDTRWMFESAELRKIPWMAGSSLPISYRQPDATLRWKDPVEACLGVGYSGLDIYGFHTLDFLQSILERRENAEKGIRAVQCLSTDSIPRLLKEGIIRDELFDVALASSQTNRRAVLESQSKDGAVFLLEYEDGLVAPVLMLPGLASAISATIKTPDGILSVRAEERPEPRYPHFAYLLKGIEQMIHTGQAAYPFERTVIASGALDRLLISRKESNRRIETPELKIPYVAVDYGYAPHIDLERKF